ncbi:biotin-dependent carboxyltransferase family protein [Roseovarius sp. M141]|uniref:5-oxoprolinase subunit C family protein n=1 Tax=Roseovarius sp. M141 TaxID=2583806 RepID=UPI0020CC2D1F|nr:biotin-dependent carboxyltransferase family protein [Roseovarius sp. M141]MCQ0093296.1 biotin-dependent carboxyltransferase family protein [Roseovarius sp. M141]
MSAALIVQTAGPFTTVQDLGRVGHQAAGIPVSGALDPVSLRIANALVGNEGGEAALEIRLAGPVLKVNAPRVRIALCGTSSPLQILTPEPREVPPWQSVTLERDTVFRVPPLKDSVTAYLAVEGGFDLLPILGSRSTCLRAGFGGLEGRTLADGDALPLALGEASGRADMRLGRPPTLMPSATIRVVLGPQDDYFSKAAIATLLEAEFRVTNEADRMGLRLAGPVLAHENGYDITSDGIATGAIQVPGDGQPIILLADHQTTGGYPKIATVISTDLPALGRLAPGALLRFAAVSVTDAQAIQIANRREISDILATIAPLSIDPASLSSRALLSANLISGVVNATDTGGD